MQDAGEAPGGARAASRSIPEPAIPEPAIPEPAIPEPAIPEPGATEGNARPSAEDPALAVALHDASNELTVVLGWIERARSAPTLEEARAALETVAVRAGLARDILREAVGAAPSTRSGAPAQAGEIVAGAAAGLEPEASRAGVRIAARVAPEAALAPVVEGRGLLRALHNLLANALAFSPPGGRVELVVDLLAGALSLRVSDEGPGIEPSRRASLFSAPGTTRPGGAGVGLRAVASLASAAGGSVSVEDGEGGASFVLRWPLLGDAPPARPPASQPRGTRPLEGVRVLLLEDDAAVVDLLETALEARGATVLSVRRASELDAALASVPGAGRFGAVLCDLSPIRGREPAALTRIAEASPGARLLIITGDGAASFEVPPGLAPTWVRKPFDLGEIVGLLAGLS